MALINCSECGKEVSNKAIACPNCGAPVDNMEEVNSADTSSIPVKFKATQVVGPVKVDSANKLLTIHGRSAQKKKGNLFKGVMAVSTFGMSIAAEKALGLDKEMVGSRKPYSFKDLVSYDLLEDDSIVTSGGIGMALVGGALLGGAGLIAGGIVGKRKSKKIIEDLSIKVTLNDFQNPCIIIPLIDKPVKVQSTEYKKAYSDAQKILSLFDIITHSNSN